MFRTSYVHHQEGYIVHTALRLTLFIYLCKQLHKSSLGIAKPTRGNRPPLVHFWLVGFICKWYRYSTWDLSTKRASAHGRFFSRSGEIGLKGNPGASTLHWSSTRSLCRFATL